MLTLQIFVFFGVLSLCSGNNRFNRTRAAIVITLAGKNKLSEYFEWSCRSIGNAAAFYDMLVFHESNTKVKELHCAPNVKLIDLGENGLSAVIGSRMMNVDMNDKDKYLDLFNALTEVMLHIPRILVEIKPMTGHIFKDWLLPYSHWTFSDPDIIWANLHDWVPLEDLKEFDIVTVAKTLDAGRLFIRGQFALHKNRNK